MKAVRGKPVLKKDERERGKRYIEKKQTKENRIREGNSKVRLA